MSIKALGQRFINEVVSRVVLPAHIRRKMIDAVLAVDYSPSMQETDIQPNRLAAAQDAAMQFVHERRALGLDVRVGVVGFGELATAACLLTSTEEVAFIESSIRGMSFISGTNITAGLLAAESLFHQSSKPRAAREIHLLTDGIHNVGPLPHQVAERLKQAGCTIHTLGIGGNPSAVDEALLKEICSRGKNGTPLYEFVSDRLGLMRYFGESGGLTR